jgi:putative tryptophan/tyrosine transport system substrate-binding protein
MRRIGLAAVLVVALVLWPFSASAPQTGRTYRIAVLVAGSPVVTAPMAAVFKEGLREHGYIEGKNAVLDFRYAENSEQLARGADELIRLKPDVIVCSVSPAALAAKNATKTIPIVFSVSSDPVAFGLVDSLARPGGNVTGFSTAGAETSGKRLELLKEVIPSATRIAVIWNSANAIIAQQVKETETAAKKLGLQLHVVGMQKPEDIEGAVTGSARERVAALIVLSDFFTYVHRERIADLALKNRIPLISEASEFVVAGSVLSYGPSLSEFYRRTGYYVDKILRGAKPADLPVEQPTQFELAINLKTAKVLGLAIPQSILLRANQVIE